MEDPDESLLVEHWTDEKRRERYQYYAREKYEFYKAAREATFKANIEYGKWLLASGLVVHGGAIYAINTIKDAGKPQLMQGLMLGAQWNVAGIVFILIAGLAGWLNFQAATLIYNEWANPLMVYKTDQFPTDRKKTNPVGATRLLSIFSGLFALWAFIASAATVFQALKNSY